MIVTFAGINYPANDTFPGVVVNGTFELDYADSKTFKFDKVDAAGFQRIIKVIDESKGQKQVAYELRKPAVYSNVFAGTGISPVENLVDYHPSNDPLDPWVKFGGTATIIT